MKKALTVLSSIIIVLFILALYGWMVNQIGTGKKKFGFLTEPIKFMYSFPDLFKTSVKEVKTLPKTFIPTPKNFKPVNKLNKDLNVLISYSNKKDNRSIVLMNLKNDSILKSWDIENPFKKTNRIWHPILYPDGSLLYKLDDEQSGLIMQGPDGKIIWKNKKVIPHHSMNLNKEGDIWSCTNRRWMSGGQYYLAGEEVRYNDFRITKYEKETGKILFDKSITEILAENNIGNYVLKTNISKDPLHLNDVEPALKTTEFYQEDDVFLSLRNISVILHYRPSTNELIDVIEGPFIHQHDVDFLNDSTLVLFNNNTFKNWSGQHVAKTHKLKNPKEVVKAGTFQSNLMSYNLRTKEFKSIGDSVFKANDIHTTTEGLVEFLNKDTYFVEEQNSGLLWVIKNDEVIYKNVIKSQHKGHHHLPNWARVVSHEYSSNL
ncbi:MAG: hypothetical protein CMC96_12555 [Flavobacteriales bacterium]|nr:hypothetical protein [Flavobacteriales bacterium]|tara:strand:- start:36001 stop:37296 length:1296 start_codon:yes stop_codon:yes gene_type:complete